MDISAVNMKNDLQCFKPEILRECATNTKIPLRISSKRDSCAPDGNRTIYVYQLVMRLTSGFASGKGTFLYFMLHPRV